MLTREAVLRNIASGQVEPIQQLVSVDYDNELQMPLGFNYAGRQLEVVELLGAYRETRDDPSVLYLVRTRTGVYALYPDLIQSEYPDLWRCRWVLHFRVEEQEEDSMLVDFKLKQAVDFHGHLCPDLVIGYRISQYALQNLILEMLSPASLRIIVENTTSAVDAVQRLTGCTIGNGRLQTHDYGRHVYTFMYRDNQALKITIRPENIANNSEFLILEARLQNRQATMQETARYQILLDERVDYWLETPFEALFETQHITARWPEIPITSALAICDDCNQAVVQTHLVDLGGKRVCRVCAAKADEFTNTRKNPE